MDLILENAKVLTMDAQSSVGWYVAISGDRIASVGSREGLRDVPTAGAKRIDCQGMTLVPGFNDAHIHVLAYASSLLQVDCRPSQVSSIADIVDAVRQRASVTPAGQCIRAFGYDEFYLAAGRHPTRHDLDAATRSHPLRLDHRTGHASVLNSVALTALGIGRDTPDHVDGVIDRDEATGEPTGLLFEMLRHLRPLGTGGDAADRNQAIALADKHLLSKGITSIQDAGADNGPERWYALRKLKQDGSLTPRLTVMRGAYQLDAFEEAGLNSEPVRGDGNHDLSLGAVKVMLSFTTGAAQPEPEELRGLVERVHRAGHQLAIHAVEREAVELAVSCLLRAQREWPRPDARHRIEHCCECPLETADMLAEAGAMVVTQPAFTHAYGDKYLALTTGELHPHLYPLKRLRQRGIPLAAGSDAPVASPNPLLSMYAARTRRTVSGAPFNPYEAVSAHDALWMETTGGAYASFQERDKGSIAPCKLADLVLLSGEPGDEGAEVVMTMVGGRVVWER